MFMFAMVFTVLMVFVMVSMVVLAVVITMCMVAVMLAVFVLAATIFPVLMAIEQYLTGVEETDIRVVAGRYGQRGTGRCYGQGASDQRYRSARGGSA
ncbi:MAG: hypothetical protein HKL95_10660 [Phycisphaerae bacterium]|nr:hypothetical protein [Phycisphaerae bacterium]